MRLGVDIGGTDIKFGITDKNLNILKKLSIPTKMVTDDIIEDIVDTCRFLKEEYSVKSIGIGSPGKLDRKTGMIVNAVNLPFSNVHMVEIIKKRTGFQVYLENDGNCAALGEAFAGSGKNAENMIMVTLGTGIGGGIIINRRLYLGQNGDAGEFGHMSINCDGQFCLCGNTGCWEHYASVTALIKQTETAARQYRDSLLARVIEQDDGVVNGKTVFTAIKENCQVAQGVYQQYINYLTVGIRNIIKLFQPSIIVLAGGITKEGDNLVVPLVKQLNDEVPVTISKLQNDAGITGASLLWKLLENPC